MPAYLQVVAVLTKGVHLYVCVCVCVCAWHMSYVIWYEKDRQS
jgi:hypothetical protein